MSEKGSNPWDEVLPLDVRHAEFAIRCFVEWQRTCQDAGRRASDIDAEHSSLLRRLLSGKPKLEKAPPRRFSYPCYELSEGKPVHIESLFDENPIPGLPGVVIDQAREWDWVDKGAGLLRHKNGDLYRVRNKGETRVLQKVKEER